MSTNLADWALPRLSKLLPLDDDSLKQVITYTASLSKQDAADHLKNLLGDSPSSLELIAAFNTRSVPASVPASAPSSAPISTPTAATQSPHQPSQNPQQGGLRHGQLPGRPKRARQNIHALPARRVEGQGATQGAYRKDENENGDSSATYSVSGASSDKKSKSLASNVALRQQTLSSPDAVQRPATGPAQSSSSEADRPSQDTSLSTPGPAGSAAKKTKVSITGGTAMHGASTVLSDLDSAIKSLELQTNPTLTSSVPAESRACNCMATRHPLLSMAPNCLSCGKIVCLKQGLGPCTFCHTPLLSSSEISSVLRVLKDERGREKQAAGNAAHQRAETTAKPRAFTGREFLASTRASPSALDSATPSLSSTSSSNGLTEAKSHRDRLLAFQSQNAHRTQIHDEAADYDVPFVESAAGTAGTAGTPGTAGIGGMAGARDIWASPLERARQLKRQQKIMREMEAANRPEYEKRRTVVSLDVVGGKVVKRFVDASTPLAERTGTEGAGEDDGDEEDAEVDEENQEDTREGGGGAFSNNPLLGALIRPTAPGLASEPGSGLNQESSAVAAAGARRKSRLEKTWRRVQDDNDDNENVILDGGVYGGQTGNRVLGAEEHAVAVGA